MVILDWLVRLPGGALREKKTNNLKYKLDMLQSNRNARAIFDLFQSGRLRELAESLEARMQENGETFIYFVLDTDKIPGDEMEELMERHPECDLKKCGDWKTCEYTGTIGLINACYDIHREGHFGGSYENPIVVDLSSKNVTEILEIYRDNGVVAAALEALKRRIAVLGTY